MTRERKELSMPITTSKVDVRVGPSDVAATSAPPLCEVIQIDRWRDLETGVVPNAQPIGALVSEYEKDPARKARLERARKAIAKNLDAVAPNALRTLRLERGFSQSALATQIGTTQAQIARIESGRQDVQIGTLCRLASALGIEPLEAIRAFLTQRSDG